VRCLVGGFEEAPGGTRFVGWLVSVPEPLP